MRLSAVTAVYVLLIVLLNIFKYVFEYLGCVRTIDKVYSCLSEVIVLSNKMTMPPPSTVSIVRAKIFGVIASKSYE